jgi:hypothetical protein
MREGALFDSFEFIDGVLWFFYSLLECVAFIESKKGAFGNFNLSLRSRYAVGAMPHKCKNILRRIKFTKNI